MKGWTKHLLRWEVFLLAVLIGEILVFGHLNPRFLRPRVLLGSINDFTSICVVSLFVTFVLVTGGMDIQAGAIVGLASIGMGLLWKDCGLDIWTAAAIAVVAGGLCGALSGFFVAYTGVQPMVVTLGDRSFIQASPSRSRTCRRPNRTKASPAFPAPLPRFRNTASGESCRARC
ncbi:MAG: hypothetical protein LUE17_12390 [Planctomycetaceae bacterium]|nr:hypothetical protein [Planctomycetaceae bacterium]